MKNILKKYVTIDARVAQVWLSLLAIMGLMGALSYLDLSYVPFRNMLTNPGFESGKAGYTVGTGVTAAIDTSTKGPENRPTMKLTLTAATGDLFYQDVSVSNVAGVNEEHSMTVYNSGNLAVQVCARQNGSDVSGSCVSVPNGAVWSYTPSAGSVGASGTTSIGVSLYASGTISGSVWVSHAYVGKNRNLGTVAQPYWIGGMSFSGAADISSTTSNTTFTSVTGAAYYSQITQNTAGSSDFKVPNLGPGIYKVDVTGGLYKAGSTGCSVTFSVLSSVTDSNGKSRSVVSGIGSFGASFTPESYAPGPSDTFYYSTSPNNLVFTLQAAPGASSTGCIARVQPSVSINVYYFPTQSQTVASLATTPVSWSGTITGSFSTTNTSIGDFGTATGTVTPQNTMNATCSQISGNLPGLTCTLAHTGLFQLCYNATGFSSNTATSLNYQLTDASNATIGPQVSAYDGNSASISPGTCTDYTASSKSVSFKVRGAEGAAGTLTLPSVYFQITDKSQSMPQPYATGNVSSTTTGQEHIERASFGGSTPNGSSCTTSPCTIWSQSGSWLTSVSRGSTGSYTLNIASGEFSAAPICTVTPVWVTTIIQAGQTATSASYSVASTNSSGTATDGGFSVICMGPH